MSTAQQVLDHLQAYGLKKMGGNRYRFNSPFRPHADGMTCSLVIHDEEHGAWRDHKDDCGGSLYDLAQRAGLERVKNGYLPPKTPDYTNLEEYALAHGVTRQVFTDFYWSDTTYAGSPALAFKTRSGTRYRMLKGKSKFLNPNGFQACWYGLNEVLRKSLQEQPILVYVNGEASVVVGQHFGIPAFTIAGGGERPIPAHLLHELKGWLGSERVKVLVALDCDAKGIQAAGQLQEQFSEAGFEALALDLNLWEKGDLADFCKLHQAGAWAALQELPPLTHTTALHRQQSYLPFQFLTIDELFNLPPVEWFIEGLIQKDAVGMIYGDPGIGKSFFAADVALALAGAGHSVIYNIAEDERGFAERIKAWVRHHKQPARIVPVTGAVALLDNNLRESFIQQLGAFNPDIVFIDTVARSMLGGDENSARDVGHYIQACEEIRQRFGCTVVLIHHTNKGGLQERGSTAFRGAVNFIIRLSDADGLIRVESDKARSAAKFEPMFKKLLPLAFTDTDGREIESAVIVDAQQAVQTQDDPLTPVQDKIVRLLALSVYDEGASRSEIAADLREVPTSTLTWSLAKLKELAYICQPARGMYQLSPLGYAKIGTNPPQTDTNAPPNANNANNANDANDANEGGVAVSKKPVGIVGIVSISDPLTDFAVQEYAAKPRDLPGFEEVETRKPPNHYDLGL